MTTRKSGNIREAGRHFSEVLELLGTIAREMESGEEDFGALFDSTNELWDVLGQPTTSPFEVVMQAGERKLTLTITRELDLGGVE